MEKQGGQYRMIIVCDIDCVLNNLIEQALHIYNSRSCKNIRQSDITSYNFFECLSEDDANGIMSLFKEKELWDSLTPIKDSEWGLQTLIHKGHRVCLATATDPTNFQWKIDWLKKYFPFVNADSVIRIVDKSLLRADIMIDDCLDNLIGNICERICLDYPWNRSDSKDYAYDIYRAKNWIDIVNIINDIERKDEEWKNQ